jgi:hypothetical protein
MKVTEAERTLFLMTPAEFNAFIAKPRLASGVAAPAPFGAEFLRENRTDN